MQAKWIQKTAISAVASSFAFSTCVSAVNLADVPLVVAEVAQPNIMVLFDTSGSMQHVTPGSAYDPTDTNWETCPSSSNRVERLTDNDEIHLHIRNGYPEIIKSDDADPNNHGNSENNASYYWYSTDTNTSSNITYGGVQHEKACFKHDDTFDTVLTTTSRGTGEAKYTGHYLNYYFGSVLDGSWVYGSNDTLGERVHPNELKRVEVGHQVISSFIDARRDDGINLGVARFNREDSNDGAVIIENVQLLTGPTSIPTPTPAAGSKATIKATVSGLVANGSTPIAESLIDIGGYFLGSYGFEGMNPSTDSNPLIIHPGAGNEATVSVGGVTAIPGIPEIPAIPAQPAMPEVQEVTCTWIEVWFGGCVRVPYSPATLPIAAVPAVPAVPGVAAVPGVFQRGRGTSSSPPSPIDQAGFCEKNFIIAMTDGLPTADENDIGPILASYRNGGGDNQKMDDVAQALFEMDLRPDVNAFDGVTPYLNNIKTYLIGFADPGIANSQLFLDTAHAGSGGVNTPYFPKDLDSLNTAFAQIIADIFSQEGSVASVSFNSGQLESDSAVFQAKFNTNPWSGNLVAFRLNDTTGVIATEFVWDAAVTLDERPIPHGTYTASQGRNVFTFDSSAGDGTSLSIANWSTLPTALKDDLYAGPDINGDGNTSDVGEAQRLLQFLLGDNSNEGVATSNYRVRDTQQVTPAGHPNGAGIPIRKRLGDIVNSTPVFVGTPELNWPDYSATAPITFGALNDSYSDFKARTNIINRTPMMYVGANDGMLHGFEAAVVGTTLKGLERLAYVPSMVFSAGTDQGLHYLAQQNYAHKFYVDLTPTISDVYISNGVTASPEWRTVLVGGLRGGGSGLFALDVTDPAAYGNVSVADNTRAVNTVLWEFTHPELGFTFSQPTIAKMPNGRWAAITGNGYNSASGDAKLFIIYLDGGVDGSWTLGTDYLVIPTNSGSGNGLSTPRVADTDGDLVADRIYAGDLKGNMWVFDVSATNSAGTPSHPTNPKPAWGIASGGNPLFTACDSSSCSSFNRQAITSAPVLVRNPSTATIGNDPNVLVLFGTGQFLEAADPDTTSVESYYSVWDNGSSGGFDRSDLALRTISESTLNANTTTENVVRTVSGSSFNYNTTNKGWYMNLPSAGERVVADSQVRGKIVFFNSIIPDNGKCSPGGTGWLMSLDFATGLAPAAFPVFDANRDGSLSSADLGYIGEYFGGSLPAKSGLLGDRQYTPGSDGSIVSRQIQYGTGGSGRRLSWEEVYRQ